MPELNNHMVAICPKCKHQAWNWRTQDDSKFSAASWRALGYVCTCDFCGTELLEAKRVSDCMCKRCDPMMPQDEDIEAAKMILKAARGRKR